MWVLGIKFRFFERAINTLNCWSHLSGPSGLWFWNDPVNLWEIICFLVQDVESFPCLRLRIDHFSEVSRLLLLNHLFILFRGTINNTMLLIAVPMRFAENLWSWSFPNNNFLPRKNVGLEPLFTVTIWMWVSALSSYQMDSPSFLGHDSVSDIPYVCSLRIMCIVH